MKVLIIDDEDDIRRIAKLSLMKVGKMEVVESSRGAEGIQIAEREQPDCILLDMMMPEMDGTSVLSALLANERTAGIPVIFLTAKAMPSEVDRLKSLGATGVLTKPFNPMNLPGEIRALIGRVHENT